MEDPSSWELPGSLFRLLRVLGVSIGLAEVRMDNYARGSMMKPRYGQQAGQSKRERQNANDISDLCAEGKGQPAMSYVTWSRALFAAS